MPSDSSLVRSARAVRTFWTPSRSSECTRLRDPVVQFTITGVFPAKRHARYSVPAPTEAGNITPTYEPGSEAMMGFSTSRARTRSRYVFSPLV